MAGQWVVIPQVGRQANRRPTKSSVMRVQRKFVEEVSGDEEGVVKELNQEGAKEKELQVNMCFSCLYARYQQGERYQQGSHRNHWFEMLL